MMQTLQTHPCKVKLLVVSNMTRAKETADIIARHIMDVPLLNEGRPCHTIPGTKASESTIAKTDEDHERIEQAFEKYFYRADYDVDDDDQEEVTNLKSLSVMPMSFAICCVAPCRCLQKHGCAFAI